MNNGAIVSPGLRLAQKNYRFHRFEGHLICCGQSLVTAVSSFWSLQND